MSEFWTELMKFLDIDARMSSPYHPQANWQAERTNQTLKQVLRTLLLSQDETRWPELIVLAEIAINGAPIANTEYSPFYLNFGITQCFGGTCRTGRSRGQELRRRRCGVWYIG